MVTTPRHGMFVRDLANMPAQMVQAASMQPRDFAFFFPGVTGAQQSRDDLLALNERMRDNLATEDDSTRTPAGLTFFGQFVDHDLTLTGVKEAANGPDFDEFRRDLPISALQNLRTPEFELDSVFGPGPEHATAKLLYRDPPHDLRLRTGSQTHQASWDLPREPANADGQRRAIIGDGRNDENKLIAQVHAVFLRAYNKFYERAQGSPTERYNEARRLLTESYHYILVHDYVRRFATKPVFDHALATRAARYRAFAPGPRAEMPAEFAFAMFRFGHSQVRDGYALNATNGAPTFSDDAPRDLSGLQAIGPDLAWDHRLFFDDAFGTPGYTPPARLNRSRRIDTRLAPSLFRLKPPAATQMQERRLGARNMLRARAVGLATGEQVAAALGLTVLTPEQLGVADLATIRGNTPLWYYILKEAELAGGEHLGTIGSVILAETIIGVLAMTPGSFFRNNDWSTLPRSGITTLRQLADFAAI